MLPTFHDIQQTLTTNDTVMAVLTLALMLAIVSTGRLWHFIVRQTHDFFYRPKSEKVFSETSGELHYQLFLAMQTCFMAAMAVCILTRHSDTATLATLFALAMGTMVFRLLLYTMTNRIFFPARLHTEWLRSLSYLTALEGTAIMPGVLLQMLNGGTTHMFATYALVVLITAKVLSLMKTWNIFFRQKPNAPQLVLYFSCIELVPLAVAAIIAVRATAA